MKTPVDQSPKGEDPQGLHAKPASGGDAQRQAQNPIDLRLAYARIREALESIIQAAPQRDRKWFGMTARDIALFAATEADETLKATPVIGSDGGDAQLNLLKMADHYKARCRELEEEITRLNVEMSRG